MLRKPLKMIFFTTLLFCFLGTILFPLFVQAHKNLNEHIYVTNELIDPKDRSIYFFKTGQFDKVDDWHQFHLIMIEGRKYIAKLWITAPAGGDFDLILFGDITYKIDDINTNANLKRELLEVEYTADATITGRIILLYVNPLSEQKPTYTLYANKAGFTGLWWIILSGIGILALFIVMFTFMIIGMKSVASKKKRKRRRK